MRDPRSHLPSHPSSNTAPGLSGKTSTSGINERPVKRSSEGSDELSGKRELSGKPLTSVSNERTGERSGERSDAPSDEQYGARTVGTGVGKQK